MLEIFSKKEPERRSGRQKNNRNAVPVRSGPNRSLDLSKDVTKISSGTLLPYPGFELQIGY